MRLIVISSLFFLSIIFAGCAVAHKDLPDYKAYPTSDNVSGRLQPYSGSTQVVTVSDKASADAQADRFSHSGYLAVGESKFRTRERILSTSPYAVIDEQAKAVGADLVLLQRTTAPRCLRGAILLPQNCRAVYYRRTAPPLLGVAVSDASSDWRDHHGHLSAVQIDEVIDDTPATRAGLQKGDVIVKFDETPVSGSQDFGSLAKTFAGKNCKLTFYRGEETKTVSVKLGS